MEGGEEAEDVLRLSETELHRFSRPAEALDSGSAQASVRRLSCQSRRCVLFSGDKRFSHSTSQFSAESRGHRGEPRSWRGRIITV